MNKNNVFRRLRVKVQLIKDSPCGNDVILKTPEEVAKLTGHLRNKDREHLLCLHLSTRNTVLGIETVSIGSLNANIVHPREVFKGAILNNAASVILVHNHPSGSSEASEEDIEITKRIVEAGKIIGIDVIDHVIVGDKYVSMKEEGLM